MSGTAAGDTSPMRQIGEVSELVGLSLRTIRYYEEVGLAPPSGRSAGGFRLYTDDDVERLRLIMHMKPLDFTLEEMRRLLEARAALAVGGPGLRAPDRRALLDRIEMFAVLAEERCTRLREQLEIAESLASQLRAEARP